MRSFEFSEGTSNKFWNIDLQGNKLTVRFGVAAAKLLVRQPFEIFPDKEAANRWLEAQSQPKVVTR